MMIEGGGVTLEGVGFDYRFGCFLRPLFVRSFVRVSCLAVSTTIDRTFMVPPFTTRLVYSIINHLTRINRLMLHNSLSEPSCIPLWFDSLSVFITAQHVLRSLFGSRALLLFSVCRFFLKALRASCGDSHGTVVAGPSLSAAAWKD